MTQPEWMVFILSCCLLPVYRIAHHAVLSPCYDKHDNSKSQNNKIPFGMGVSNIVSSNQTYIRRLRKTIIPIVGWLQQPGSNKV